MFHSSDHLLWLSLSLVQNVALPMNNPWPRLSLVLRCCPDSACCPRPKENPLPKTVQSVVGLDGLHTWSMPWPCFTYSYRSSQSWKEEALGHSANQQWCSVFPKAGIYPSKHRTWNRSLFFKENCPFPGRMPGGLFERMMNYMAYRNSLCYHCLLMLLCRLKHNLLQLEYLRSQQ